MIAIINRTYTVNETCGNWRSFNEVENKMVFECKTIELPDLGNQHNISCVPEGIYDVEKINSPTKGPCFLLKNVPGRSEVEIHIGNYAAGKKIDTEGCILPGMKFIDLNNDGNIDVAYSTAALSKLLEIMPDKFKLYIV
jgi:hypothetical protein